MQQAAQMQEQMARMQDEAEKETAQSSVGGGLVKVTANGAGDVVAIEISPDAIDPEDPEALADLVLAGVNEALRSAQGRCRGEGAADARRHGPRRARAPRARRVSTPPPQAERPRPLPLLELALGAHRPRPDRRRDLGLGVRLLRADVAGDRPVLGSNERARNIEGRVPAAKIAVTSTADSLRVDPADEPDRLLALDRVVALRPRARRRRSSRRGRGGRRARSRRTSPARGTRSSPRRPRARARD